MVPDFKDYLVLLKSVHSAGDLRMMIDSARWACSGDLNQKLSEVLANNDDWDTAQQLRRVTDTRKNIPRDMGDINAYRDVTYMDLSLEGYAR
jgi:hypothetical protein